KGDARRERYSSPRSRSVRVHPCCGRRSCARRHESQRVRKFSAGPPPKKLVTPAARREAVTSLRERYPFSERRACRVVGIGRTSAGYRRRRRGDEEVRARLRTIAAERPRFGYRRLLAVLRREGIVVNHKRVARLCREEGLAVRRRSRKRIGGTGR